MVLSPGAVPDPHGYFRGDPYGPREVTRVKTPEKELARRAERQQKARERMEVRETKQILFGDTHVHTTYSTDAFRFSLPFWQGSRGAFPPADACDYARYVSQIDFYFLTDHAESYAPEQWRDAVESVRQCNGVAGDPKTRMWPHSSAGSGPRWGSHRRATSGTTMCCSGIRNRGGSPPAPSLRRESQWRPSGGPWEGSIRSCMTWTPGTGPITRPSTSSATEWGV